MRLDPNLAWALKVAHEPLARRHAPKRRAAHGEPNLHAHVWRPSDDCESANRVRERV